MHFEEFAKAIAVWVGGLSTAYTLVFLNAIAKGSRGFGAFGTKMVLMAVALAALLFIFRGSKARWGAALATLLVLLAATHIIRPTHASPFVDDVATLTPDQKAQQAAFHTAFPLGCNAGCEDD